jgi:hypothetical protein
MAGHSYVAFLRGIYKILCFYYNDCNHLEKWDALVLYSVYVEYLDDIVKHPEGFNLSKEEAACVVRGLFTITTEIYARSPEDKEESRDFCTKEICTAMDAHLDDLRIVADSFTDSELMMLNKVMALRFSIFGPMDGLNGGE